MRTAAALRISGSACRSSASNSSPRPTNPSPSIPATVASSIGGQGSAAADSTAQAQTGRDRCHDRRQYCSRENVAASGRAGFVHRLADGRGRGVAGGRLAAGGVLPAMGALVPAPDDWPAQRDQKAIGRYLLLGTVGRGGVPPSPCVERAGRLPAFVKSRLSAGCGDFEDLASCGAFRTRGAERNPVRGVARMERHGSSMYCSVAARPPLRLRSRCARTGGPHDGLRRHDHNVDSRAGADHQRARGARAGHREHVVVWHVRRARVFLIVHQYGRSGRRLHRGPLRPLGARVMRPGGLVFCDECEDDCPGGAGQSDLSRGRRRSDHSRRPSPCRAFPISMVIVAM